MPDYFTLAELRSLPDVSDAAKYPDETAEAIAAEVAAEIERVVEASFVPRERTFVQPTTRAGRAAAVPDRYILEVTSAGDYAAPVGRILGGVIPGEYAAGTSIDYLAGYTTEPPLDIKGAALQWTRRRLISRNNASRIDDRKTRVTSEAGTFDLAIAGKDRPSGYPEVDVVLVAWRDRLAGFGLA